MCMLCDGFKTDSCCWCCWGVIQVEGALFSLFSLSFFFFAVRFLSCVPDAYGMSLCLYQKNDWGISFIPKSQLKVNVTFEELKRGSTWERLVLLCSEVYPNPERGEREACFSTRRSVTHTTPAFVRLRCMYGKCSFGILRSEWEKSEWIHNGIRHHTHAGNRQSVRSFRSIASSAVCEREESSSSLSHSSTHSPLHLAHRNNPLSAVNTLFRRNI